MRDVIDVRRVMCDVEVVNARDGEGWDSKDRPE